MPQSQRGGVKHGPSDVFRWRETCTFTVCKVKEKNILMTSVFQQSQRGGVKHSINWLLVSFLSHVNKKHHSFIHSSLRWSSCPNVVCRPLQHGCTADARLRRVLVPFTDSNCVDRPCGTNHRRRNRGAGGPGPPDFFVWGAQYDRGPPLLKNAAPSLS